MPKQDRVRAIVSLAIALIVVVAVSVIYGNRAATDRVYETASVRYGDVTQCVRSTGELTARSVVEVSTQISGKFVEVNTDINKPVKKGQILGLVDPFPYRQKVQQAQSELTSAESAQTLAQLKEQRLKGLLAKGVVTQQDYDEGRVQLRQAIGVTQNKASSVRTAEDELRRCTITAPIDGILIGKKISVGETVQASFSAPMLFAIAEDLKKMRIVAPVTEVDIGKIKEGLPVTFKAVAIAKRTFHGRLVQIRSPYTSQQNQQLQVETPQQSSIPTFDVLINVDNGDLALRPRFTADVCIIIDQRKNVLLIPNSALRVKLPRNALMETGGRVLERLSNGTNANDGSAIVYRMPTYGAAAQPQATHVKLGLSDGVATEVLSGLKKGDQVVIAIDEKQQPRRRRAFSE